MNSLLRRIRSRLSPRKVGALAAFALLPISGCGGDESTKARDGRSGEALIVNAAVGPATLDLQANACGLSDFWAANFYVSLAQHAAKPGPLRGTTRMDTNKIEPYLASWEVSQDGRKYTLRLNPNAKFNDGSPIDAEAVKFSLERSESLGGCGAFTWSGGNVKNMPTAQVIDSRTVVLRYPQRSPTTLPSWANKSLSVFQPDAVAKHPDESGAPINKYWAAHIAGGGGPFILEEYEPNQSLVMRRNPNFFGEPAASESVRVNFIQSETTLALQARNGQADVTLGLSADAVAGLKNDEDVKVAVFPAFQHLNVNLNWDLAPLDKVKFREALTYAVPYSDILQKVAKGYGTLYYGPITQEIPFFNRELSQAREFNIGRATELVKSSGVRTPVNIEMAVLQGDTAAGRIATILQNTWKQIGVNLKVSTLGPTEYNDVVFGGKAQTSIRLDGPGAPTPAWLLGYDMTCDSGFNASQICIPEADKLLEKAKASSDPAVQQRLYDQITRLWRSQSPKIILYGINEPVVLNKRVTSYHWYQLQGAEMQRWGKK